MHYVIGCVSKQRKCEAIFWKWPTTSERNGIMLNIDSIWYFSVWNSIFIEAGIKLKYWMHRTIRLSLKKICQTGEKRDESCEEKILKPGKSRREIWIKQSRSRPANISAHVPSKCPKNVWWKKKTVETVNEYRIWKLINTSAESIRRRERSVSGEEKRLHRNAKSS